MVTSWDDLLFERFVEPLIDFANLPGIAHVDEVHGLFAPAIFNSQAALTGRPVMQVLRTGSEAAFEDDRKRVRGWLDVLSRSKLSARAREQVQLEIQSVMNRTVELRGSARFAEGVLSYYISPVITGVEGVISFGAAMLADDTAQRWKQLGRCKLKGCPNYFLRKPRDWRQEYCEPSHSQKANDAKRPKRSRTPKKTSP